MADAIPVNKKQSAKKEAAEYKDLPEGAPMKADEFKARVDEIVAAEVPAAITDKQVGEIGQQGNYGKVKTAEMIPYFINDPITGETKRTGYAIRVTH